MSELSNAHHSVFKEDAVRLPGVPLEQVQSERYMQTIYELTELQCKGTPFEGLPGQHVYELNRVCRETLGDEQTPRNELALYLSLLSLGVPHETIVAAFRRLPRVDTTRFPQAHRPAPIIRT